MVIIFYTMQSKAKLAGLLLKANFFYCFLIVPFLLLTLARTCKFIPPPWTVVQGGGVDAPPPLEFLIRCSISKRFYLQWKAFDILHKMRYILSVMALLGGPMTSPKMVTILDLPRIRNQVKTARNGDFFVLEKKNNTK